MKFNDNYLDKILKTCIYSVIPYLLIYCTEAYALQESKISVSYSSNKEIIVTVDPHIHIGYGISYPLTYEVAFPKGSFELRAYRRYTTVQEWTRVTEKTSADFFNGIEAVRFDYVNNIAYISVVFSHGSDSLFLKISDNLDENVSIKFEGISQYYDDRDAAVTCTADDWQFGKYDTTFQKTIRIFREYHLWVSGGIITGKCDEMTWNHIQAQLDSGYLEAVSHSRTHASIPYDDPVGEIAGSKQDIIKYLNLPASFKKGEQEYVYAWICPFGEHSDEIDSLVGLNKYLVSRTIRSNFHRFSEWDECFNMYEPVGLSRVLDSRYGTADIKDLNNTFDNVVANGGIYHLLCHPYFLEVDGDWDKDYTWSHLEYISNKTNLWYVSLGHLYLYHLIQNEYFAPMSSQVMEESIPGGYSISQNFPNPFNAETVIRYQLLKNAQVTIIVYNITGQIVQTLVDQKKPGGYHSINWNGKDDNGKNVSSGIYFYKIITDDFVNVCKMVLVR